ncbi:MAG: SDR family oxidoreductase [Gallionella sp.]|nr:SDR family oxidoreductase [Gallionella sp.]
MRRLLIIGCGDVARRAIPLLIDRYRVFALVRNPAYCAGLRALGVMPVMGDLDDRHSLARLGGIAEVVLHFAPPPNAGVSDMRTRHLLAALSGGVLPQRLLYISTSGVYGDCAGAWVSETHPTQAKSPRALRRVDAEQQIRAWAKGNRVRACILRVPGIYAHDRLPLDRLRAGTPAVVASQDSYSNHIHADDLAHIVIDALRYGKANRVYHTTDDDEMKMGDYFDAVADAHHLPRPPRLPRAEVQSLVSPMLWSFMNESRRLTNRRMKQELKVRLIYPTVEDALL